MKKTPIYIIGIGIEGKSSLSQRAIKLIEGAGMLVAGKRHLAGFPEFQKKKVVIGSNLDNVVKIIKTHSRLTVHGSRNIIVLATGDPSFFGIAYFLIKKLGKDSVTIIPNVSAMQEAFARIKGNWNDARFFSLHGRGKNSRQWAVGSRKREETLDGIVDEIVHYDKVGIFTDAVNTPAKIADAIIKMGSKDYMTYVCEDLGTDKERITQGTLSQIAKKRFSSLNVMILIRLGQGAMVKGQKTIHDSRLTTHGILGIPDSEFSHSKGMITKEEIRVVSLSKLKLKTNSILWDIGAGSGSLSIEAAMLATDGKVFAVEKEKERVVHIEKNKNNFKTSNLEIICKKAPEGLRNLPVPDAVFIGGGGKDIDKILNVCSMKIRKGGRIVVNAITIETLAKAAGFFKKTGWDMETVSVNIAKTNRVAESHLFHAHNPVFIIVGEKP